MSDKIESVEKTGKVVMASVTQVMAIIIVILVSALFVGSIITSPSFADTVTTGTNTNETLTSVDNVTTTDFGVLATFPNAVCTLTNVFNSSDGDVITSGNYTQPSSCTILAEDDSQFLELDWNVTYNFTNTQNNLGGVNVTTISDAFGLFVAAIIGFFAVIGVIIAIVWLIGYIRPLFSKEDGIQNFVGS